MKRTPLKRKGKPMMKRSSIKKKARTPEQVQVDRIQREQDMKFYIEIWNERPHYCEVTGQYLGSEFKTIYADHLLEKSQYPQFRHEKCNIILVTGDIHSQKTNGFPHPEHKRRIEQAKRELLNQ